MLIVVLIVVPAPDDVCVDDALGRCDQVLRSSDDDIVADLSISVPTVTSHSRSIRQKIRGSTRVHIVIWAYEDNVR